MCPILVRTVEILHKTSSAVFTSLATHACSTDTPVLGLLMSKELERTRSSGLLFFPFPSKSPLIRLGWPREVTWVRKDRTGFWAVHKGPLPSACAQSKLWSVGKVCSWWLSHRCHVFSWSCWTPRTHGVSILTLCSPGRVKSIWKWGGKEWWAHSRLSPLLMHVLHCSIHFTHKTQVQN